LRRTPHDGQEAGDHAMMPALMKFLRVLWAIFTWAAFGLGVAGLALAVWTKAGPSLSQRFAAKPAASSPVTSTTNDHWPASGIHPEFIQNLNNYLANSGSTDSISALAYDPRNHFFLVGRESGAVDIWSGRQANARREVKAHKMRASQLAFSSDGRVFFSNSYFEDVTHVWDTATGSIIHSIEGSRGPVIETSDPNLFVIAGGSGMRIFDLASKGVLPDKYRDVGDVVTALAYDGPTDQLAIGTASGGVEVWKLDKTQGRPALAQVATARPYAMGNWVTGVHFFDKGRSLYSLPQRGNLDEWSALSLERLRSREVSLGFVSSSVFIPEKSQLAMIGFRKGDNSAFNNFLEVFNLSDGTESLIDLKENGSGVIVYLPLLSTIISGKSKTISVIDIAKAR
jgi:WD40 repeat protein